MAFHGGYAATFCPLLPVLMLDLPHSCWRDVAPMRIVLPAVGSARAAACSSARQLVRRTPAAPMANRQRGHAIRAVVIAPGEVAGNADAGLITLDHAEEPT